MKLQKTNEYYDGIKPNEKGEKKLKTIWCGVAEGKDSLFYDVGM